MAKRPVEGDRVRGTYFGQPFTGIVTAFRYHTINDAITLHTVRTDEPVLVVGRQSTSVAMSTDTLPGVTDAYGCMIELEPEGPLDFPWWLAIEPEMAASLGLTR